MSTAATEPYERLLEAYARLVIRIGANVQVGQRVEIRGLPEQAAVARALAAEAYRVGASHVTIDYADPHLQRAQVEHAPEDMLGFVRPSQIDAVRAWNEDRPAIITLTGNPLPELMDGLDPARLAASQPVALLREVFPLMMSGTVAWTMVAAPTPGWAASIGVEDVARLWDAVAHAMRLDEDDPVQAWRDHIAKLKARRDILNARGFDAVRYRGPGTDVTLGLSPSSRWAAATLESADGVEFAPNMPTEEVYFSPDWRRAEGHVRTTAPFFLPGMGTVVEDLAIGLHDGTIVGATAARGEEAVRAQLDSVARAKHLGEVSIVDGDSRVRETGLLFKDVLYDENVGSHIAWGNGFAFAWENGIEMTPEQRIESGLNQSGTHVDIVVGSPEVQIEGIGADGSVVPIVEGNEFVLRDA
ncbi:aminopeptidase [Nocardioides gansuensis]|nr:aminopeptidase [Nocardioides gansuensis]